MKIFQYPLFFLFITVVIYQIAVQLYEKSRRFALFAPILVASSIVAAMLYAMNFPVGEYSYMVRILPALLGPTVVALVVPFFESLTKIRAVLLPVLIPVFIGGAAVVFFGYFLGKCAGLDVKMDIALLTRSATAPIALGTAEKIGGDPSLTMIAVLTSGMIGSLLAPFIFSAIRISEDSVRGFTLGFTSHAFGVAQANQISADAAAFATLGMGIMGIVISILLPLIPI